MVAKKQKEIKHKYIRAGKTPFLYKIKRILRLFWKWVNPIEDRTIKF